MALLPGGKNDRGHLGQVGLQRTFASPWLSSQGHWPDPVRAQDLDPLIFKVDMYIFKPTSQSRYTQFLIC